MTARNQPHKYRCETCKEWSQQTCPLYASDIASDGDFDFQLLQDITELVGCASHSDAGKAEQRVADVIKELEKLRDRQRDTPIGNSFGFAYNEAIMLLRGKEE